MGKQILILNFDGEDGSTTYTEEVQGLSPLMNTNSEIDTSWKKFGTGSLQQTGVIVGDVAGVYWEYDVQIIEQYTFHFWIRIETFPTSPEKFVGISTGYSEGLWENVSFLFDCEGKTFLWVSSKLAQYINVPLSAVLSVDTDYHIAITVNGRTLKVYIDGELDTSYDIGEGDSFSGINVFCILLDADDGVWRVDAVELTTGIKWTGNFTPPTSAPGVDVNLFGVLARRPYQHILVR